LQRAKWPLNEGKFHFFLSHCQSTGGDQCHTLYLELRARGFLVWYDQAMQQITEQGMTAGIKDSANFVLFLTEGVFSRPFVLLEIRTALKNKKRIILLHESDSRFGVFNFSDDSIPEEFKSLLSDNESIPYRRRAWEKDAMFEALTNFAQYKAHECDKLVKQRTSATARRAALEAKVNWADPPVYLDGTPVSVFLKLFIKSILGLDYHTKNVQLKMTVVLRWLDARVYNLWQECKTQSAFHAPHTLWRPGFDFAQGDDPLFFMRPNTPANKDVYTMNVDQGILLLFSYFNGQVAVNLDDLSSFPFDETNIELRFTGNMHRDGTPADSRDFVLHPMEYDCLDLDQCLFTFDFNECPLQDHRIIGTTYTSFNDDCHKGVRESRVVCSVILRRRTNRFVSTVVIPATFLFLVALTSVFLDVETDFSQRCLFLVAVLLAAQMLISSSPDLILPARSCLAGNKLMIWVQLSVVLFLGWTLIVKFSIDDEDDSQESRIYTHDLCLAATMVAIHAFLHVYWFVLPMRALPPDLPKRSSTVDTGSTFTPWADTVAKDCNKSTAASSDRPKARASDVIARASMKSVRRKRMEGLSERGVL
jgi:hypothetical protein